MHRRLALKLSCAVAASSFLAGGVDGPAAARDAAPAVAEEGGAEVATPRGDASLSGEQPGPGPAGDPVELWRLEAWNLNDPVVAGGVVYVSSFGDEGRVVALDAATGAEIWRSESIATCETVEAVAEGQVYLRCRSTSPKASSPRRDHYFAVALDAATGREQWRVEDPGAFGVGHIAAADGAAYMHVGEREFVAVDAANGRERWRVDLGLWPSKPAVVAGVVYVGAGEGLHALDATDGTVLWRVHARLPGGHPAVADGLVLAVDIVDDNPYDTVVLALDAATGMEVWTFQPPEPVNLTGPLAVAGGAVFVRTLDRVEPDVFMTLVLYALDAATGAERWTAATTEGLGAPSVADGVVYLGYRDGGSRFGRDEPGLLTLDAATGAVRWHFGIAAHLGNVVVVDGIAYVVGRHGSSSTLYAIGGSALPSGQPSSRGAWRQRRRW
jgi:outer membrane protein assembly factor BamB